MKHLEDQSSSWAVKLPELRYLHFALRVYLAGKPQLARDAYPHRLPIIDRPYVSIIRPSVTMLIRPSVTMHIRPSVCVPCCRSSFSLEYTSSPKVVCWSVCTAITLFCPPSVLPRGSLLDFLVCLYVADGLSGDLTDPCNRYCPQSWRQLGICKSESSIYIPVLKTDVPSLVCALVRAISPF